MQFYHLDRLNTFPVDKSAQLFSIETPSICNTVEAKIMFSQLYPNGISKVGALYLSSFDVITNSFDSLQHTYSNATIFTKEYVFEMVRQLYFPNLPSRFTSLYACEDGESLCFWNEILKNNSMDASRATVKIIEAEDGYFIGDANWRDLNLTVDAHGPVFSPFSYHAWAHRYWCGERTVSPKTEVLCRLPVTVKCSIPLFDFIRGMRKG